VSGGDKPTVLLQRIYAIESWALVVLGIVHMSATSRFVGAFTTQALWFLGGGILMVLVGAMNLLNRAYGGRAPGLRLVCIAANITISAFAVAAGYLSRASLLQWIIVLGIVVPLTVLSCSRMVNERKQ
jgi:hypothetical protein